MNYTMHMEQHCLRPCNPSIPRISSTSSSVWQVLFPVAAIAILLFFWPFSARTAPSSASAHVLAIGSIFMSKKALFVLSNLIFLLLANDYRCCFTICSLPPSTSDIAASESKGIILKQAQLHHEEVKESTIEPYVSHSGSLYHKSSIGASESCANLTSEGVREHKTKTVTPAITKSQEQDKQEDTSVLPSESEPLRLDDEVNDTALVVVVEQPSCEPAQELEKLEIDELNRKFEEFIQSERKKWIEEALQLQ